MKLRTGALLLAVLLDLSCSSARVTPPAFDGQRAYGFLQKQVSFGPRVPGSDAWQKCRGYFYEYFRGLGLKVDSQAFTFIDPYSHTEKPLVNVIVHIAGKDQASRPMLVAAHWDSRPRCDNSPNYAHLKDSLPGANDGASGVAVLMELATMFASAQPANNIDLVLLDGEDWGKEGSLDAYFLGAKHFASADVRGKYRFGIVLDMVGDKQQEFCREIYSERFHKPINDMIWGAAKELQVSTFVDSTKFAIEDDHLALNVGGIPSVDVIDFDYDYWHTEFDTPDKCSPESLGNVGRVMAFIAYNPSIWPSKP